MLNQVQHDGFQNHQPAKQVQHDDVVFQN